MKKLLVALVFGLFSSLAFASVVQTNGLTDDQIKQIELHIAQLKVEPNSTNEVVKASDTALDVTKKWAEAGKGLTIGIVAAAKEAGVAVNDFSVTPVGKLTMGIIIWKMLGKDILAMVISFSMIVFGLPFTYLVYKRVIDSYATFIDYTYEERTGLFGRKYRELSSVKRTLGDFYIPFTVLYVILSFWLFTYAIYLLPIR